MNARQKRFCEEYLVDCNATQAAIRAGYSTKTAYSIGVENLKKPELKSYIDGQLALLHTQKTAEAQEILEYLTSVMRGESESAVVVVESVGDGMSEARLLKKPPDEKDRLKAAELLGKRYGIFTDKVSLDVQPVVLINDLPDEPPSGQGAAP